MSLALDRLLKPRSVVIVGASDKPGALGASVLANLERSGYSGDIHLINPKREDIFGRRCLKSIEDLPFGVDAAVLAIPQAAVLDAVSALAGRGVGSVVIFSAGFAEGGEAGLAQQREIARIASQAGMVIEGPNCLGFVNFVDGVPLTFIEMSKTPLDGRQGIGIVSQSGAIAAVVDTSLLSRGLGLSYSISTGNEAGSGVEDYIEFLIDDPDTTAIGMVVEQFRKPRRFIAAARRARQVGKQIVLLHPGRSSAARESAATHTGAMAGDFQLMKAKVERAGVILVETLEELGDCLEILVRSGPIGSVGSVVIGESGAFKAVTLDFAESVGLHLPVVHDDDSPQLRAALPTFVPVSNPVDMTAQGLVDPSIYGRLVEAACDDERFDKVIFGVIQTDRVTSTIKFPAIIGAIEALRPKKPILIAGLDEGAPVPEAFIAHLRALGVVYFPSTERAFRAIARLEHGARRDAREAQHDGASLRDLGTGVVPEYRAKALLAQLHMPFPKGWLVTNVEEAKACAAEIGYPVVIKAQSSELSHKSDAGGVIVGIADEQSLEVAMHTLESNIERHRPGLALDGILVEAMGERGLELIVGGRNDPEWGPIILAGFGGVQAEILQDVRLLAPDLSRGAILAELGKLKSAALLQGFRGEPARDLDAIASIIETVSGLLLANPQIQEIDLNPVVVYPVGQGASILDALIYLRESV